MPSEQRERIDRKIEFLHASEVPSCGEGLGEARGHEERMEALLAQPAPRQIWLLAEDFALRRLAEDFGEPVERHVAVTGTMLSTRCSWKMELVLVQAKLSSGGDIRKFVEQAAEEAESLSMRQVQGELVMAVVSMQDLPNEEIEEVVA
ncbi:MAG: hypothetical protein U5K43_14050 [Halofilum sp. (in: g-proteobacteria)]|nr:hypothetical protein [Halofilum sp. (in: g-proteobacteria)]